MSLGSRGSLARSAFRRTTRPVAHEARTRVEVRADPHSASAAACPPLLLPQASFAFLFHRADTLPLWRFPPHLRDGSAAAAPYLPAATETFPPVGFQGGGDRTRAGRPAGIFYQDRSSGPGVRCAAGRITSPEAAGVQRVAGSVAARPLRFCPPLRPTPQLCVAPLQLLQPGVTGAGAAVQVGRPASRGSGSGRGSFSIQTMRGKGHSRTDMRQ